MIKKIGFLFIVVIIALVGYGVWQKQQDEAPLSQGQKTQSNPTQNPDPTRIRLIATGDFIAHDSVNAAAKTSTGYDYLKLMSDFEPVFKNADIRFCNDPILNAGQDFGIAGYPRFNSPTEFVKDMGRVGCNLVNTASNHSFDFSQEHIDASVEAWETVPDMLAVAGQNRSQQERDEVKYFTVKNTKFAFLAYTTYSNAALKTNYGVSFYSQELADQQIKTAKQNGAQIIIVSMRWGTEYASVANALQQQQAKFLAEKGADIILGHGPHVLQPVQQITGENGKKTTVWYSLGNFLNSQIEAEALFNGLAVIDIDIKSHQITNQQFLPIYMHYEWSAVEARAQTLNARTNLKLYLLENAQQDMLASQQLNTTIDAQRRRMADILKANGLNIPLITSNQL